MADVLPVQYTARDGSGRVVARWVTQPGYGEEPVELERWDTRTGARSRCPVVWEETAGA